MLVREVIKAEIDLLDDQYLELLSKIIHQFPRLKEQSKNSLLSQNPYDILKEIADTGGLGIDDPVAWQCDMRQERELPFRID